MKYFSWSVVKNDRLKTERNISFEEIVFHIEQDGLLDIIEHPNLERYKSQRVFIVNVEGYAYLVPYVETGDEVFLKTIIPSRKATRRYIRRDIEDADS